MLIVGIWALEPKGLGCFTPSLVELSHTLYDLDIFGFLRIAWDAQECD